MTDKTRLEGVVILEDFDKVDNRGQIIRDPGDMSGTMHGIDLNQFITRQVLITEGQHVVILDKSGSVVSDLDKQAIRTAAGRLFKDK